jgi:glycine/D-amino acid oxidase-like deaminating enzyme
LSDVIVIGCGIIGSAIAYRLALAGARVTVLGAADRRPTSAVTFSWTNANAKQPHAYFALNVAGMGEHQRLELELGEARFFHHTGNVEWALTPAEAETLEAKVKRLQAWAYPAELIDRADLRAIDPSLRAPDDVTAIAFFPSEGYVDAMPLCEALLQRVRKQGGEVRPDGTVRAILSEGGRAAGVALRSGEILAAGRIVCAAGRWTAALLATAGFHLPMAPTRGVLVTTSPTPTRLRTMLLSSSIHLRPEGEGRILLQNTATDMSGDDETFTAASARLDELWLGPARRVVGDLGDARAERVELGIRAIPGDGLSVAGYVPGCEGLYVVCSHSGVTLAPYFAHAVARELLKGEQDSRLAGFRPERFCKSTTSP